MKKGKRIRPALTPESRENQLVALAIDLADKENCLMTAAILVGVCTACLIKARSFDKI